MNEPNETRLPFALPAGLVEKLRARGVGPGFYGKITFHIEHGQVIRTVTEASDVAVAGVTVKRQG
jgi:hypothetical protein